VKIRYLAVAREEVREAAEYYLLLLGELLVFVVGYQCRKLGYWRERLRELEWGSKRPLRLLLLACRRRVSTMSCARPGVTVDSALRLARYSGTIAEFWTGQQADHDLRIAESSAKKTLAKIKLGLSHELII
jgi:plasmid maintenance system antidote protein VapI